MGYILTFLPMVFKYLAFHAYSCTSSVWFTMVMVKIYVNDGREEGSSAAEMSAIKAQ